MSNFSKEEQAKGLIAPAVDQYKKGQYEKCIETCDKAIALDDFVIGPYVYKALSLIGLDKYEEGLKICNDAIENIDNFETAEDTHNKKYIRQIANAKGLALFYLKRYDEAQKEFDHAQRLKSPNSGITYETTWLAANNLGRCHYMLGNYEEAIKWFDKALKLEDMGNFNDPYYNKALALQKLGNFDKAMELFEKLSGWAPYNPLYWNAKGLLYVQFGKEKQAARCFDKAQEFLAKGVQLKGQTRTEKSALQQSAEENRNKLLATIPRLTQLKLTDETLVKQRDEIFHEVSQALQDNDNNRILENLLKRMEELEKKANQTSSEVAEVKKVGNFEENKKKQEEMATISADNKLYNYYKSFNSLFSKTYAGYITVSSGLVQMTDQTPAPISILTSVGQKVPMFGEIFGFFQQGISKVYEIKTTNEATRMSQLASNTTEMDRIVENVARALTLDEDKKNEILTVQEKKQPAFIEFFKIVKSKIYVEEYDTPEKQLAFKDATMLVMACASGKVDSNQQPGDIEKGMLSVVVRGKFEQAMLDECKDQKDSNPKASSPATNASPNTLGANSAAMPREEVTEAKTSCCNMF